MKLSIQSPKLIDIYIAKSFLAKFLQVSAGFALLIFFLNLIDVFDKIRGEGAPFSAIIAMAFLQIPNFLNDVVPSLVLFAALITFFLFSSRSEITIARTSGFSLWQILKPINLSAILLGIFWITIFEPISVEMIKKFNNLENKYIRKEVREFIAPENGIWLKQINVDNPEEEIIIQAKKVYQETIEFDKVTVWFFNKDGQFYKKFNAEKMFLQDKIWLLHKVIVNDGNKLNETIDNFSIPTNLESDFILQKIVNNFQNVKLFTFFELPSLIKDLESAGFNSVKFKVYFNSLLSKPLLFLAMTMISCYFGLNHIRNRNTILLIFIGIIAGLILYIIATIINALGSSGLISIFASTWVIAIIFLAIGTLLIYHKENL